MKTTEITHTTGNFSFDGRELILSENGEVIADIRSCNHDGEELEDLVFNRDPEEAEANGRLLAAAPELLTALTHIFEKLNTLSDEMPREMFNWYTKGDFNKIQSAIKKATPEL